MPKSRTTILCTLDKRTVGKAKAKRVFYHMRTNWRLSAASRRP